MEPSKRAWGFLWAKRLLGEFLAKEQAAREFLCGQKNSWVISGLKRKRARGFLWTPKLSASCGYQNYPIITRNFVDPLEALRTGLLSRQEIAIEIQFHLKALNPFASLSNSTLLACPSALMNRPESFDAHRNPRAR